jgi:hypothetical protein
MNKIQELIKEYKLQRKEIVFLDIFDPMPINSGGDWYRYQILSGLSEDNNVIEYYTKHIDGKKGYCPQDVKFERKFLENGKQWTRFWNILSPKMNMIKPDLLFNKSSINNIKADIVFTIAECYHIARHISKINRNAPIILVMHNIEWKYLKDIGSSFYIPMRFYENRIMSNVDGIISISTKEAEYAAKYIDYNKVFHIPPKTYPLFTPDGEKYNYGNDKFNLLFYGSLDREQNVYALKFIKNELIPAMKEEGIIEKVRVNIFGSGVPPKFLNLEKDKDINFLGTVDDPSKYIRGADLVLVPLKNSAGIKIRIIETLGCNKPIIATPEAVENLSNELKEKIFIKSDIRGFIDVIKTSIAPEFSGPIIFDSISNEKITAKSK